MGTDIHIFVEKQVGGKWEYVTAPRDDEKSALYEMDWCYWPAERRNYDLFAMLANVRNGTGFAGCDTGTGFEPISEPRDVPFMMSSDVQLAYEEWGKDCHDQSWLALDELLALGDEYWNKTTEHHAYVSATGFIAHKDGKEFPSWCYADVSGANIIKLSGEDVDLEELRAMPKDTLANTHVSIAWPETYRDAAGKGWWEFLELLKALGDPATIRMVFWFDS